MVVVTSTAVDEPELDTLTGEYVETGNDPCWDFLGQIEWVLGSLGGYYRDLEGIVPWLRLKAECHAGGAWLNS